MKATITIAAVLLSFLLPVGFLLWREWAKSKKSEQARKKKEPVPPLHVIKVAAVLGVLFVPVFFISDSTFVYYGKEESSLKLAFKHSGKKIADCDEVEYIKREGERYRQALKDTKHIAMDTTKFSACPRERHPVRVEVYMDGAPLIDKKYIATGIKKDMASYIYEEFIIKPGPHKFTAALYDDGKDTTAHTLEAETVVKPTEVKVIRFDDKLQKLVLE